MSIMKFLAQKNERITINVKNITTIFETCGATFVRVGNVFNILTK